MNSKTASHYLHVLAFPKTFCVSIILLLMIVAVGVSKVRAQNNPYKISDNLYEYYVKAFHLRAKPTCLTMADSLYTLAEKQGDKKAQCLAATLPVEYYRTTNEVGKLELAVEKCKEVARTNGYLQYYYHAGGALIIYLLNRSQSLRALQEATAQKEQAIKDNFPYGYYSSLRNLGNIYMSRGSWNIAYHYYHEALDYMLKNVKDQTPTFIYQNLGYIYLEMNNESKSACDSALYYYRKSIESSPVVSSRIQTMLRMCHAYFILKDVKSFNRVYDEMMDLIKTTGFPNSTNLKLAKIYHAMLNNYESEASRLISQLPSITTQKRLFSEMEESKGNYKEALELFKEFKHHSDMFKILQQTQDIAELTTQTDNLMLRQRNTQLDLLNTTLTLERTQQQMKLQKQETEYGQLLLYNRGLEIDRLKVDSALQRSVAERRHSESLAKLHKQEADARYRNTVSAIAIGALVFFVVGLLLYRRRQYLNVKVLQQKNLELSIARDEAEAANRTKSAFIQNMSHEIRTPLNAIVGFAQIITMPELELDQESLQEYSKQIKIHSDMLTKLVYDILSISELESGTYEVEHEPIRCNEICADLISSVNDRTPPGVKLYWTSDVSDDFTIHSDSKRLRQVLVNFLLNAQKFTEQGEIHLECSAYEHSRSVTFSVTDTGCGVPPEESEHIFERFVKLDEFKQGLGLGLNICRLIAQSMKATVTLDKSYTSGGARFLFIIPKDVL